MQDVRLDEVRAVDQVAQDAAVGRHGNPECVVQGTDGGHAVRHRADAADALGDVLGVARVAADQQLLETPEQAADGPGIDHLLDAVDGIDVISILSGPRCV